MTIYFSGEELIQIAVQTEETGYEYYKGAEKQAASQPLKELFHYLAEQELKHKATYVKLKEQIKEPAQGLPVDWDEVGLYIKAMTDSSFFLGGDKNINKTVQSHNDKEAVEYALQFEKDTLLFFYQIKDTVKATERSIVEQVIK